MACVFWDPPPCWSTNGKKLQLYAHYTVRTNVHAQRHIHRVRRHRDSPSPSASRSSGPHPPATTKLDALEKQKTNGFHVAIFTADFSCGQPRKRWWVDPGLKSLHPHSRESLHHQSSKHGCVICNNIINSFPPPQSRRCENLPIVSAPAESANLCGGRRCEGTFRPLGSRSMSTLYTTHQHTPLYGTCTVMGCVQ